MSGVVKRSRKLAFYGVTTGSGDDESCVFHRMKGFDDITTSKNPKEYSRQYVDEEFEQTDVVGYTPSISFSFDRFAGDEVHDNIIDIFNNEKVGKDAIRTIIIVDLENDDKAIMRDFTVVAENEGSGTDLYKYSGSFRVKGNKVFGIAESKDNWNTCVFLEN